MSSDVRAETAAPPPPWLRRATSPLAAVPVLAGFWLLLLGTAWNKSLTYDETVHAAAGYSYWKFDDYRLNPENGNLPQRIAALPLLSYSFPTPDTAAWRLPEEWTVGDIWFNRMGHDVPGMLHRGRAVASLQAVALAALVWACARRLFGPTGGLVALLLCVLNPTILANGSLMTSDAAAALFFLAATWAWWSLLHRLTPGRLALSALATAGLFVAKSSAILIVPIGAVLVAARLVDGRPLPFHFGPPRELAGRGRLLGTFAAAAVLQAVVVYVAIWGCYGFRYAMFAPGQPSVQGSAPLWSDILGRKSLPEMITALGLPEPALQKAQKVMNDRGVPLYGWDAVSDAALPELKAGALDAAQARQLDALIAAGGPQTAMERTIVFLRERELLPEAFVFGTLHAWRFAQMRSAFFNGEFSSFGAASFFPYTFAVKTPLAMFGVLALAAAAAVAGWLAPGNGSGVGRRVWDSLYATLPFWTLFGFYWFAVLNSRLNIGHRHILATYPPLFVLGGAAGIWIEGWLGTASRPAWARFSRQAGIAAAGLLAIQALEVGARFPHYLAYFNGLIRPSLAYQHFVDSTLDWGQDLPGLKAYLDEHGREGPFYVSYFGNGDPRTYGIQAQFLLSNPGRFQQDRRPMAYRPVSGARPADAELAALQRDYPEYELGGVGTLDGKPHAVLIKKWATLRPPQGGTFIFSATNFQKTWRPDDETNYQELKRQVRLFLGVDRGPTPQHSIPEWGAVLGAFEGHSFGRLATFLLQFRPDDDIGHSMLVFKMTAADVDRALDGPAPTGRYTGQTLREAFGPR
jgi:hypothetical protein